MSVWAMAANTMFGNQEFGRDALYTPFGGSAIPVRVIEKRPDIAQALGLIEISTATAGFFVRLSEVADANAGDTIKTLDDGVIFVVQGSPNRDTNRVFWNLDTYPA
jgi:hypothetical protein